LLLEATAVLLTSLTVATVAGPVGAPRTAESAPTAAVQSIGHAVELPAVVLSAQHGAGRLADRLESPTAHREAETAKAHRG